MKIEVFKMYFCKKISFLLGFRIAFGAQVAVLRSWRVAGAPPRPSARPASGRRRPSGTAARAAPPWRRAAAPRRLGKAAEMSMFVARAQTKTSADFLLTFQNVCRLALRDFGGSLSQPQLLRRVKTPSSADIADRLPRKVVQALWALEDLPGTLQCPCPQTKSCMNLASVFYLTMVEWEWCPIV